MREIKFRAWCNHFEQMVEWNELKFDKDPGDRRICFYEQEDGSDSIWNGGADYTIMQYTGLKDKNGKEIYEGDILRFPPKDEWEKESFIGYEVFYHDNDAADNHVGFQMNRLHFYGHVSGGHSTAKLLPRYTKKMIVIGNIFENPELLEDEQHVSM